MSFWKILGGVAVGVGAVAAAPFTGGGSVLGAATLLASLSGAGTIAAAVGAGAIGAAAGAAMGNSKDEGYREGQKDAKAEYDIKSAKLLEKLEKALSMLKENKEYFNAIYAMEAVAVACANCDGKISIEERDQIELFIKGISSSKLPDTVKKKIQELYDSPLNIKEAHELARRASIEMSIFDDIINLVIHADGVIHENENAFVEVWQQLKAA